MSTRSHSGYDAALMHVEALRQRRQVDENFASLDDAAFERREDGKWSVGQCLEHLALVNTIYLDAIDEVLPDARRRGLTTAAFAGRSPKRHGWIGDSFVRSLEPPPKPRLPAFKRIIPSAQRPRAAVLTDFFAAQDRLARAIDWARDLDLARVRMRSPFFRLIPLSLGQAFGAMLAHNRRHIWQAEGVLGRS